MRPAALYLKVSTGDQTVENQRRELQNAAMARGWAVVETYTDNGISGSKGRDSRPGLDAMLKAAVQRKFNVVLVWAVDRLGRSLPDLIGTMQELHGAKVDLFLLQQGFDTTTPSGNASRLLWYVDAGRCLPAPRRLRPRLGLLRRGATVEIPIELVRRRYRRRLCD
jgi:DNA invertase Pin-like site-specific DNA recombinase